jgi:arylsulfatase A-like enzyme
MFIFHQLLVVLRVPIGSLLLILFTVLSAPAKRPNILLIMADDVGIDGFGCYGGTSYPTPHIDALAKDGMRFTHAYSQPLCTPTRVQIMTGKYNHRNWSYFGILDPAEKTFGHLMKQAGYRTCITGKWQLQSYDPPDFPNAHRRRGKGMHVDQAGFDEYCLYHAWHTEDKGSRYADPTYYRNGSLITEESGKYGPDRSVDFLLDFMKRNRKDPMFLYYPMALPHWPMVPTPDSAEWKDPENRQTEKLELFADMVTYMDKLVGRLVDGLDELGLRENTLVLFYSDNGTHLKISSTLKGKIVQGGKATPLQTGIRVPLVANWPGTISPGSVTSDLVDASDFYPTFAELAKTGISPKNEIDGISFLPTLLNRQGPRREWCFFWYDPRPGWDKDRFSRHIFALDHNYKLFDDGRMFDIRGTEMLEKPIHPSQLDRKAKAAKKKLRNTIDQMMQGTLSPHARKLVDAYGNPLSQK